MSYVFAEPLPPTWKFSPGVNSSSGYSTFSLLSNFCNFQLPTYAFPKNIEVLIDFSMRSDVTEVSLKKFEEEYFKLGFSFLIHVIYSHRRVHAVFCYGVVIVRTSTPS